MRVASSWRTLIVFSAALALFIAAPIRTGAQNATKKPLTYDEIQEIKKGQEPIPVGVMGWFAKVGASRGKGGKAVVK